MEILIHEFYRDPLKALVSIELQDELQYHEQVYGCLPKKVNIIPYWANCNKYPADKNTMTLFAS